MASLAQTFPPPAWDRNWMFFFIWLIIETQLRQISTKQIPKGPQTKTKRLSFSLSLSHSLGTFINPITWHTCSSGCHSTHRTYHCGFHVLSGLSFSDCRRVHSWSHFNTLNSIENSRILSQFNFNNCVRPLYKSMNLRKIKEDPSPDKPPPCSSLVHLCPELACTYFCTHLSRLLYSSEV